MKCSLCKQERKRGVIDYGRGQAHIEVCNECYAESPEWIKSLVRFNALTAQQLSAIMKRATYYRP